MSSNFSGLTTAEARERQTRFGKNELTPQKKESFFHKALESIRQPMFLLLLIAATIYMILGEPLDGAILFVFVGAVIGIDVYQEWKTDKTLSALKDLSAPRVTVIRDGLEQQIASVDLVPDDLMRIAEGDKIPADGLVVEANDLCVDESSLTGEAEGVWKRIASGEEETGFWRRDTCYAGTLVLQGSATVRVTVIGAATEYGKIGRHIAEAPDRPTPLEKQTGALVKLCAGIAAVLFALLSGITYLTLSDHAFGDRFIASILSGITLAMAMIPEEFPVILTVFLSMGAWRLAKKQTLVRRLPAVETLGAVSVLCVDKTGTITENQMTVREVRAESGDENELLTVMGLACETAAYDPMEKAMLAFCEANGIAAAQLFSGRLVTEYPFTNELKMMGHVWERNGDLLVAAKGSPERIWAICDMEEQARLTAEARAREMADAGLRVIAVAQARPVSEEEIPKALTDCRLTFCGLIGLWDPPRASVKGDVETCRRAGIRLVMITGDSARTAASIARQIGMTASLAEGGGAQRRREFSLLHSPLSAAPTPPLEEGGCITGDALNAMTDEELQERVKTTSIFARVIPEHKMRIVKALRANGEVVAMTGDGVNDAPALKYADIGIAMGGRGSQVAREAADLILMDDNFSTIVDTVRDGRRITDNIRKAVGYVFAIHIPIALSSLLAPLLGVAPANLLLLPLHVVLLELILDPTCSVVLERQPAERDIMQRGPRDPKAKLLPARTLVKSLLQGLAVFAAAFGLYFVSLARYPDSPQTARALGLTVILLANLFLVQVNSSDRDSAWASLKRLLRDKVMWAANLGTLALLAAILYTPLNGLLRLAPLTGLQLLLALGVAAASVLWYEIVKWVLRRRN
ncbi:MAG: cation-translocating P-type ATPase [Clostridiales bacterium]|nr:cation-translocating P-type ATPase [Clostridiales bacterium]